MERKNFLIGLGAASAAGGAVLGSGAFSRVESDRYFGIEVAEDPDAYLGLDACDSPHGEEYVDIDENGRLEVDIAENGNGGEGVNSNSRTWFDDLFQVCNQGSDDAYVWIQRGEEWPVVEEGPDEGEPRVDFYLSEDEETILGADNAVELAVGECQCIGIRINTHGVDATAEETLLEEIDDRITIVADTESPEGEPELATFEVSELSPTMATVTQGEPFEVSATVENTGGYSGEQAVDLSVDGDVVASQSLSLEASEAQSVTFEGVETADLDPGEHDFTIATADDQASGTLLVEEAASFFEVSDLQPAEATVEQGDTFDVSASITNTGSEADDRDIELSIDGEVVASQSLSLEADETQMVTFEAVETNDLEPGEYTHAIASADDEASGTLIVETDVGEVQWHRDLEVPVNPEEATNWDNYDVRKILDQDDFMDIEVAPDGRVFYITRGYGPGTGGSTEEIFEVGYVDPDSGENQIVLEQETSTATPGSDAISTPARELGGQGLAIDPDFEENGHVYLIYHPRLSNMDDIGPSPYDEFWDGEVEHFGYMLVSRFELTGDELDPDSETEIIRIPQQYDSCCHHGAALEFGPEGNLWVSAGDNSEIVSAYSTIDDRESRHPAYDAGRTSSNTADLRGSVLRITPDADGGYSVPEGNLKDVHEERMGESYSEEEFRPEIFSMGYRNPYVVTVDEHTGALFTATYSPGYGSWSDGERGPPGIAGLRLICEPDYAGWPFFQGYYPYRRYDHDTGELGQPYWIDRPQNDSLNNTGLEILPPYEPDLVWMPQNGQDNLGNYEPPAWADMPRPGEVTWPELQGSGGNNAGPAYRYADEYGENALPPFFEGKQFFITSYGTHRSIWYLTFNEDGSLDIDEFLPDAPWVGSTPHHMEVGPDGRAFVTNYGDGFYVVEYTGPQPEYQPPPEEEWPERVEPGEEGLSADPPGDATVLWDGETATLDDWETYDDGGEVEWNETADYFETEIGGTDIQTGEELGDIHLHAEWRAPESSDGAQPWANSALYMMQRYEFQVLDDYNQPTAASPSGSYYSQQPGMVHAVRPPGEWNTYDLFWRTPRWEDGELVRPAQATLFFNGVTVLSHLDIEGPNAPEYPGDYQEHPAELPLRLQAYGDAAPIQYRNLWYRDLPEESTYQELGTTVTGEHPETLHGTDEYTIDPGGFGTTGEPPEDADVLIDDLALEPGDGDWKSDDEYGDAQLHVEYRVPEDVDGEGPWRGSSGVLLMGKYEINIVDTHDNPVEADEWAGAYTHQNAPHHDAVREPGEWQQLDIVWRAPRFEGSEVTQPAQVTALLNGVAVQTRLEVAGPNDGLVVRDYPRHGKEPLRLREDGDEIQFRNTWIREFESGDLVDDAGPQEMSFPYALDAGGSETEGDVEIDGLAFDRSPDDNGFVTVTGDWMTSSTAGLDGFPAPDELEYEGTDHDLLYASEINGEEFGVVADVPDGVYDVTLHFSEWPYFSDDQVPRMQNVSIEGEQVLEAYELERGVAQVETFEDVEVTDGELNIDVEVHPDSADPYAKLNGLEIRKVEEVSLPYALDAGGSETEGDVEIDGLAFDRSPDDNEYVTLSGGQGPGAADPNEVSFEGTDHDLLYTSELYGEAFTLDVGVEDGTYDVTLHFSDWPYFEIGENDRLQNVYLEGEQVLEGFLCEPGVAQVETFQVEVTDGSLTVDIEVHPDSLDDYAKLNGLEVHAADDDNGGSVPAEAIEPGTAIELDGQTTGWVGIAPDGVADEENPTLVLAEGETYELGWTEGDGGEHNIAVRDADGNVVDDLATERTTDPGDGEWLEFTASSEMAEYVCEPHQGLMNGSIDVL